VYSAGVDCEQRESKSNGGRKSPTRGGGIKGCPVNEHFDETKAKWNGIK